MGVIGLGYVVLLDLVDWLDVDFIDMINVVLKEDCLVGVSLIVVVVDQYFWVQICGFCNIWVVVNVVVDVVFNVMVMVGVLDDDVIVGVEVIKYVVLIFVNGGVEVVVVGYIDYFFVGVIF